MRDVEDEEDEEEEEEEVVSELDPDEGMAKWLPVSNISSDRYQ
jgi:hypothetical protein